MSRKKVLIENIFSLYFLQGINYLLPLITMPYLVRVLGVDRFGLISFSMAIVQYCVVITSFGFDFTATRRISVYREDEKKVSEIFCAVTFIKTILMIVMFIVFSIVVLSVPRFRVEWSVYFVCYLVVLGNVLFPTWLFQGFEKMKYITVLNIFSKTVITSLIFVFVKDHEDYLLAAFLQSFGFVLAGLISFWIIIKQFNLKLGIPTDFGSIREEINDGWKVFISSLSGNVYGQGALLITGLVAGNTAAGYYSIAQKVASAFSGAIQPVVQAVYPYLSKIHNDDIKKFENLKRRILLSGLFVSGLLAMLLWIFSRLIIDLITGRVEPELILLIKIYSFVIFFTIMNVLVHPFILSMQKYNVMMRIYLKVAVIFIVISIPMTILYKNYGMVLCLLIVELFIFVKSYKTINTLKISEAREDISA